MRSKDNRFLKNIIVSFGGQMIILCLGMIVPKLFISGYGSDANGLLNTLVQIFSYMALFETGIAQSARNALYKPFSNNSKTEISNVATTARTYFAKVTFFYIIGVLLMAIIAPYVLKTDLPHSTVFWLVIFEGLAGAINFWFNQTKSIIIDVDGKSYINNSINVVNKIVTYVVKIVLAVNLVNIIGIQISYFIITLAKVGVYNWYFRKNYSWINLRSYSSGIKLKDSSSYILTEIAWTIFYSTDLIILSTFVSTSMASVYSVYNIVFANINVLMSSVFNSVSYILGRRFHEDIEKYKETHDVYNSIFIGGMTVLISVAYSLIIPFVTLYTKGITDIAYVRPEIPIFFCMIQLLSWGRFVSGNLLGIGGYAKQLGRVSIIEALINLGLSVLLVTKLNIVGVLIATVIALPLKLIFCNYLSDKVILKRKHGKTLRIIGINYLVFICAVIANRFLPIQINNWMQFIVSGALFMTIYSLIGMVVNISINPSLLKLIKRK